MLKDGVILEDGTNREIKSEGIVLQEILPIRFDEKQFILQGQFCGITLGMTEQFIQKNYPEPDCISPFGKTDKIWNFGKVELHFRYNKEIKDWTLLLIYYDELEKFEGKNIVASLWGAIGKEVCLVDMIILLNAEQVDYVVHHNKYLESASVQILQSNITLGFVKNEHSVLSLSSAALSSSNNE